MMLLLQVQQVLACVNVIIECVDIVIISVILIPITKGFPAILPTRITKRRIIKPTHPLSFLFTHHLPPAHTAIPLPIILLILLPVSLLRLVVPRLMLLLLLMLPVVLAITTTVLPVVEVLME